MADKHSKDKSQPNALGDFIKMQRELAHLSLRQLSELAKVSNPYLSQVERGLFKPSADVLKNIANALNLSAETIFAQAGFMDEDPAKAPTSVEATIKMDPNLTADQKDTLIRIYRGFTEK